MSNIHVLTFGLILWAIAFLPFLFVETIESMWGFLLIVAAAFGSISVAGGLWGLSFNKQGELK